MSFKFSARSRTALATAHPALQTLFEEVIRHRDCTVLEGHRGRDAQEKAVREGTSNVHWPHGNHNTLPSLAVDVAPYPIDWNNRERFIAFANFVLGLAIARGLKLRWGGDWDGDGDYRDQRLHDLPHFELLAIDGRPVERPEVPQ